MAPNTAPVSKQPITPLALGLILFAPTASSMYLFINLYRQGDGEIGHYFLKICPTNTPGGKCTDIGWATVFGIGCAVLGLALLIYGLSNWKQA